MDSFEFNKIAGAVLATALGVMALGIISEMIYEPGEPAKPGFEVAVAEAGSGEAAGGGAAAPAVEPIAVRLQTADVARGETVSKKCLACHTLGKGEPHKVGPNLWGVVGGPAAHESDFKYSDAMIKRHDSGATWTFEDLDHFLTSPRTFVPGTAMSFAGLPKPGDRADIIAYLRTLSDNPVPLPAATAAAPAAPAAPAPAAPAAPAPAAPAAPAPAAPAPAAPAPAPAPAPMAPSPMAPAPTPAPAQ